MAYVIRSLVNNSVQSYGRAMLRGSRSIMGCGTGHIGL